MPREPLHHPIQAAIEDIWDAGHTPRIQVDARRPDVIVPESVKSKWAARLVLDLDASWPLDLEASESGLRVDLAFQGVVTRCTIPWAAIYVVLDRSTGRGIVIESHMPEDGAGEAEAGAAPRRAALREVGPAEPRERASAPSAPSAPASDEDAKLRRSRFKVIDGGQ